MSSWKSQHKCHLCGITGVRLYRSYGSFLRKEEILCNGHVPEEGRGWLVPLIEDGDGGVWGYSSCPNRDITLSHGLLNDAKPWPNWLDGEWFDSIDDYLAQAKGGTS